MLLRDSETQVSTKCNLFVWCMQLCLSPPFLLFAVFFRIIEILIKPIGAFAQLETSSISFPEFCKKFEDECHQCSFHNVDGQQFIHRIEKCWNKINQDMVQALTQLRYFYFLIILLFSSSTLIVIVVVLLRLSNQFWFCQKKWSFNSSINKQLVLRHRHQQTPHYRCHPRNIIATICKCRKRKRGLYNVKFISRRGRIKGGKTEEARSKNIHISMQ